MVSRLPSSKYVYPAHLDTTNRIRIHAIGAGVCVTQGSTGSLRVCQHAVAGIVCETVVVCGKRIGDCHQLLAGVSVGDRGAVWIHLRCKPFQRIIVVRDRLVLAIFLCGQESIRFVRVDLPIASCVTGALGRLADCKSPY